MIAGVGPGVGATGGNMHVSSAEVQRIVARALRIGGATLNEIAVNNIEAASISGISEVVTLAATNPGGKVRFQTTRSTFSSLAVVADDGIIVQQDVVASYGSLYLDSDIHGTNVVNDTNSVTISDQKSLVASTVITLKSLTGSVHRLGSLTLAGGMGIVIADDLTSAVKYAKPLVLHADTIASETSKGALTVSTGATVQANYNDMLITAYDIDLNGGVSTQPTPGANSDNSNIGGEHNKNIPFTFNIITAASAGAADVDGNNVNGD